MLREEPGGRTRLAAGARGRGNIPGVMAPTPTGVITVLSINEDGTRSEQHGIDNKTKIQDKLR
jgi:hypothetical protein